MSLLDVFDSLTDPRRAEGCRTNLSQILTMVTISYLCGYTGYRKVASFCKSHEDLFRDELSLKHGVPSHVTFRNVLMRLDDVELVGAFNRWASAYSEVAPNDWVSGDGKSLKSTVVHKNSSEQDFQSIVSLFCQKTGLVVRIEPFRQKKENEMETVREALKLLDVQGLIIRLDALHTQKKQLTRLLNKKSIMLPK